MTNEVMFFAIVLLIPGAIGLYSSLAGFHPRETAWGCGLVAVIIPVMMALTIVHGRLAFPVYGIDLEDLAPTQLVVSIYCGGQHAVGLLFGVATILLALTMRNTPYGRAIVVSGLVVAVGIRPSTAEFPPPNQAAAGADRQSRPNGPGPTLTGRSC